MSQGQFDSDVTRERWLASGSPYCEHPVFVADRDTGWSGSRQDDYDRFCTTCGALRLGREGPLPEPSGARPHE